MPTQVLPLAFFFWQLPSVFGCSPLAGGGYDLKIGYQKLYLQTNFQIDGVQGLEISVVSLLHPGNS
jgi:hypothetical protein